MRFRMRAQQLYLNPLRDSPGPLGGGKQTNMQVSEKPNWKSLHPRVRPQNLRHESRDRGGGASWISTPRSHKAPTSALANSGEGPLRRVQDMLASQQVPKVGRLLARRRPALQPCQKWGSRLAI